MALDRTQNAGAVGAIEVPSAFLSAKLHGRRAALFEGERLRELASASDIAELAYRLYPQANLADQFALEEAIQNSCVEELAFLARYVAGQQREFYDALLARYAVENLKVLLRVFQRDGAEAQQVRLIHLPRGYELPVEELSASSNVEQFLKRIPLKAARAAALQALPLYESTGRRAFLEMALDRGYWQQVGAALRGLPSGARAECQGPVQCEFDSVRFTAALRAARVYGLSWEELGPLLPVGWGRLSSTGLRGLLEDAGDERALRTFSALCPGAQGRLRPEDGADVTAMEEVLWHETVRLARKAFGTDTGGFGLLVCYFYLKQEETRHLLSLTQMVRRGMGTEDILAYLER